MYYSYNKILDNYTTYELSHPDYEQMPDSARITEICTIKDITYVSVPDELDLPKQPKQIVLKEATITPELLSKIKLSSPHVKLMEKRMLTNENIRFSKQDENTLKFLSEFMISPVACVDYITNCREWEYETIRDA